MNDDLIEKAKEVLSGNYQKEGFTMPSKNLYPFQWKSSKKDIALLFLYFSFIVGLSIYFPNLFSG